MSKKYTSAVFLVENEMKWEELGGGISRQIMGYDPNLMMVKVMFEKGAIGALHAHVHAQTTYVASGIFVVIIGDKRNTLRVGDGFYVEPDVIHGVECMEAGVLIDVFNPMREDFLKK